MQSGKKNPELKSILHQLVAYTEYHFATEEKYFDKFNYELANEHKQEHKKLINKVADFNKELELSGEIHLDELINFLEDWLVDHINNRDKRYMECFNEHGLF